MRNKLINAFFIILMLIIGVVTLLPLTESNRPVTAAPNADVQRAPVNIDGYTGDMSAFVADACVVDGQPRILSYNNYGDTVDKKTIMYQRENGDIAVIYIDRATLGGWYIWASDKIANGVCPS